MQVDHDPEKVPYQELLDIFWDSHGPATVPMPSQYRSVVFYHDEEQKGLAEASRADLEAKLGRRVLTEIVPFAAFRLAEDYHQKYYLQMVPEFVREFRATYPEVRDFANSTAAARINGFLGGHGNLQELEQLPPSLGLSSEAS